MSDVIHKPSMPGSIFMKCGLIVERTANSNYAERTASSWDKVTCPKCQEQHTVGYKRKGYSNRYRHGGSPRSRYNK
jgi:hypothetical protein